MSDAAPGFRPLTASILAMFVGWACHSWTAYILGKTVYGAIALFLQFWIVGGAIGARTNWRGK